MFFKAFLKVLALWLALFSWFKLTMFLLTFEYGLTVFTLTVFFVFSVSAVYIYEKRLKDFLDE